MDVILLSYAKSDKLKQMTQTAIETLKASSEKIKFNIVIIESEKSLEPYQYDGTSTYYLDIPFNYNTYMNIASQYGKDKYIAFCNNDVIFTEEWADTIIKYMEEYDLDSASPICPRHHGNRIITEPVIYGSGVGGALAGWCIVVNRDFFETLGGFDDYVKFYCADHMYDIQLKKHGGVHALVTRSHVIHFKEQTINTSPDKHDLTIKQIHKFNRITYSNIWGVGDGTKKPNKIQ